MTHRLPVLVVDDEPALRTVAVELLKLEGYPIAGTASHGQEALDFLAAHPGSHIILLGYVMPVMDGLEVLKRLEAMPEERAKHKVILWTLSSKVEIAGKMVRSKWGDSQWLRIDGFLDKPFDIDAFVRVFDSCQPH